jgi:hypothetical protein
MQSSAPNANDRLLKRVSTLKNAKIVYNNGHCVVECVVKNLSQSGARIELPSVIDLPKDVTLMINGGPKHVCEVAWSKNDYIGVRFVDPQEIVKPANVTGTTESKACLAVTPSSSVRAALLERITSIQTQLDALREEINAGIE